MKFPSIPSVTGKNDVSVLRALKECMEILTGRRGNTTVDYGAIGSNTALALDIANLTYAISGLTDSIKYLNQYTDFHDAINKIGSTETVLVITGDAFVESNETIPTTLHPLMLGLGRIYVSSGVTLTWNGTPAVALPRRRLFYGAGTVTFGSTAITEPMPEWWGEGTNGWITFTSTDATPSVAHGTRFKTANGAGTVITMFDGGYTGQEIIVVLGDDNTDFDFTSTYLEGNAGADWTTAVTGDFLRAIFDGTNWFCSCHDTTA